MFPKWRILKQITEIIAVFDNAISALPTTIMENPFSCNSRCRGSPPDSVNVYLLPDQGHGPEKFHPEGEYYCNGECHWRKTTMPVEYASVLPARGICVKNEI